MTPTTFVRMFKPRFARLVESGKKKQTIRPTPKRFPKPGDLISLREWSGKPYRSKQRLLMEACITDVRVCAITDNGIGIETEGSKDSLVMLDEQRRDRFAKADGFNDWNEMRDWFKTEHKQLPFVGIVIYWEKI